MTTPHEGDTAVSRATLRALVDGQCPRWRGLDLRPMCTSGTEHTTYRLGDELLVRLPRDASAEEGLRKEVEWLPRLQAHVALKVPVVEHVGRPTAAYPRTWTVSRWVAGNDVAGAVLSGSLPPSWAGALADVVAGLRAVDLERIPLEDHPTGARGGHLADRVARLDDTTDPVSGPLDPSPIRSLVEPALAAGAPEDGPVLLHADLIPGNLLARDGVLVGLIDFGTLTTGHPAWDLTPAWWVLDRQGRRDFRRRLDVDDVSWAWGRALAAVQGLMADWFYAPRHHALAPLGARAVREALDD